MIEKPHLMMKNHIVVIPFNLLWEWSTDYTNQTAYILSKENIVICYMVHEALSIKEAFKKGEIPSIIHKLSKNLYIFKPIYFIPLRRYPFVLRLNELLNIFLLKCFTRLLEITKTFKKKIVWVFYPGLYQVVKDLGRDYLTIYDCVDFYTFGTAKHKREMKTREQKLVNRAGLIVAISTVLQKHLTKMTKKKVHLVPQGFRLEHFKKIGPLPEKLKKEKPVIGFVGGINTRIDINLLLSLVQRNPKWNFVVWGPLQFEKKGQFNVMAKKNFEKLLTFPNFMTGEAKKREQIPAIIKQFDVAMIPYDSTQDFNRYCYPMKLFEYFYLGKPVVSTEIEELKRFPNLVKIGNSVVEWEKIITNLLTKPWPEKYKIEQRKLAEENSWENKVEAVSKHIQCWINS